MSLPEDEKRELQYLGRSHHPLWGGHLGRGEPLSDRTMQRWLDLGLIKRIDDKGYLLTALGHTEANGESAMSEQHKSFTQNDYSAIVRALDEALAVFERSTPTPEDALKAFVCDHYFKIWRGMTPHS